MKRKGEGRRKGRRKRSKGRRRKGRRRSKGAPGCMKSKCTLFHGEEEEEEHLVQQREGKTRRNEEVHLGMSVNFQHAA